MSTPTGSHESEEQLAEGTLMSHLLELRSRIMKAVLAVIVVFLCLMPFINDVFEVVSKPLREALPEGSQMIVTDVAAPFLTPIKTAFFVGGAQIYAFSKAQLAAGASNVTMVHLDTSGMVNAPSDAGDTQPGFTVRPEQSPGTKSFNLSNGGTEYFLSSNAADEATHPVAGTGGSYTSNQLVLWTLTNTSSLDSGSPALQPEQQDR